MEEPGVSKLVAVNLRSVRKEPPKPPPANAEGDAARIDPVARTAG
jgi:hypothetical protein